MKLLDIIKEQLNNENNGERIVIVPRNSVSYDVLDMVGGRLYTFVFNIEEVSDESNDVDLWIYDKCTLEYVIIKIKIADYYNSAEGIQRINFAEKHILEFNETENKESLIYLLKKLKGIATNRMQYIE